MDKAKEKQILAAIAELQGDLKGVGIKFLRNLKEIMGELPKDKAEFINLLANTIDSAIKVGAVAEMFDGYVARIALTKLDGMISKKFGRDWYAKLVEELEKLEKK